jgi:hypothetical protein
MWYGVDPKADKYPNVSAYMYTMGNPVILKDPDGRDTIDINKNKNGKWEITNTQIVKGDDVFRVKNGDETKTYTFSEGEYGKRVNVLNLENNDNFTLGVYHVSGAKYKSGLYGFVVQPGGDPGGYNSGKRLFPDSYSLTASPLEYSDGKKPKWIQPLITTGDNVKYVGDRGAKFHFAFGNAAIWTHSCLVVSSNYKMQKDGIYFDKAQSLGALIMLDFNLGAKYTFRYNKDAYGGVGRIGAYFGSIYKLNHKLNIKDGF